MQGHIRDTCRHIRVPRAISCGVITSSGKQTHHNKQQQNNMLLGSAGFRLSGLLYLYDKEEAVCVCVCVFSVCVHYCMHRRFRRK